MEKKIVVAGHISVDITPVFQSSKKKSISQVLCPGKLIRTGEAVVYTGGVVSNTGLALHKMGAQCPPGRKDRKRCPGRDDAGHDETAWDRKRSHH